MTNAAWVYDDGGRAAAGFRGSAGDCVSRAIAIATGLPYREVYDLMNGMTYDHRQRGVGVGARSGMPKNTYRPWLEEQGWKWTPTMGIGTGCQVHLRADELPGGVVIAAVSKHIVTVIDGVIHDTADPSRRGTRCVYGYWTKG